MNNCSITSDGGRVLGKALAFNSHLVSLELSRNKISDDGAEGFSEGLKVNQNLAYLYIQSNKIEDDGIIHIANAIKKNSHLRQLFLSNNEFGDAGAKELAAAIRENIGLTVLKQNTNALSHEVMVELNAAIERPSRMSQDDLERVTSLFVRKQQGQIAQPSAAQQSDGTTSTQAPEVKVKSKPAPSEEPQQEHKPVDAALQMFLDGLDLSSLGAVFAEQEVDLAMLQSLSSDEASDVLKEIGVKVGPRVKITKALAGSTGKARDEL